MRIFSRSLLKIIYDMKIVTRKMMSGLLSLSACQDQDHRRRSFVTHVFNFRRPMECGTSNKVKWGGNQTSPVPSATCMFQLSLSDWTVIFDSFFSGFLQRVSLDRHKNCIESDGINLVVNDTRLRPAELCTGMSGGQSVSVSAKIKFAPKLSFPPPTLTLFKQRVRSSHTCPTFFCGVTTFKLSSIYF